MNSLKLARENTGLRNYWYNSTIMNPELAKCSNNAKY